MATKLTYQDADIILRLYDMRRESVMRESRNAINAKFWPKSLEDVLAVTNKWENPLNQAFRQTSGYWEMVYGFARQSGGYASIESKPGEGAAVSIVLPAVASAARQGAAYVAATASPDLNTLKQKACAATGLDPSGNCGAAMQVSTTCDGATPPPGSVNVQVKYDLQLISGYLVNRVLPSQTLTLRACATYPSLRS